MPHFFIKISPLSSNPGRIKRSHVEQLCRNHRASLEHFWHDDPADPKTGYILVEADDVDKLSGELDVHEVVTLHPAP
jgi:hypothetical protein